VTAPDERIAPHPWDRPLKAWGAVVGVAWLVLPFLAAGTLRWAGIWIYMATIGSGTLVQRVYVRRRNPAVLASRSNIGAGTKAWDLMWLFVAGPLAVVPPVVAGLGVRYGWPTLPVPFAVVGFVLNTVGGVLWARSMATNAHFENTVRIQRDRVHVVVDRGPYRVVRHPGYASFCIGGLGVPFLLLSVPVLVVAPLLSLWFVVRTALEDATLRRELAGYAEYARRVRFRLLPGVW
jgi:protein-S-isoprenylcysteine O-methyltransferase Ste14